MRVERAWTRCRGSPSFSPRTLPPGLAMRCRGTTLVSGDMDTFLDSDDSAPFGASTGCWLLGRNPQVARERPARGASSRSEGFTEDRRLSSPMSDDRDPFRQLTLNPALHRPHLVRGAQVSLAVRCQHSRTPAPEPRPGGSFPRH